jgi:secreted trypsin-like serine protease
MRTLMRLLSLGLVVAGCGASPDQDRKSTSGIVGGMPDHTPGVVAIKRWDERLWTSVFSGALIHKRWILTVAHGFADSSTATQYIVSFGDTSNSGPFRTLKSVHLHPEYKGAHETPMYDIGLLELNEDAPVDPLPLNFDYAPQVGQNVRAVGFGQTSVDDANSIGKKRSVEMRVVMSNMTFAYFLSAGEQGKGNCPGDSGGPYLFNNQVVAVQARGWCGKGVVPILRGMQGSS